MTFYFAYGSNMSQGQMRNRCSSAQFVCRGQLREHRLGFTRHSVGWGGGTADVLAAPDAVVWGAVFTLSENDLELLDHDEGVPRAYVRVHGTVVDDAGQLLTAWIYVVAEKRPHVPPTRDYLDTILRGAREAGLPGEYIAGLEAIACCERTGS